MPAAALCRALVVFALVLPCGCFRPEEVAPRQGPWEHSAEEQVEEDGAGEPAADAAPESPPRQARAEIVAELDAAAVTLMSLETLREDWRNDAPAGELQAGRRLARRWAADARFADEPRLGGLLLALALADDGQSLGLLHEIYETWPERRHLVARAIAAFAQDHRRRPEDFRILVRSLPVVEGDGAVEVQRALLRFPERATRPEWLRLVLLQALRLGSPHDQAALDLLTHWAGPDAARNVERRATALAGAAGSEPESGRVAAWQAWFAETHPDQTEPHLPEDGAGARWTLARVQELLAARPLEVDLERGWAAFEKGRCAKCHRYGARGEALGPDLSRVAGRLQLREIVESTLYPSERIPDEYRASTITTTDGRTLTGFLGRPSADKFALLTTTSERVELTREQIEEVTAARLSPMPGGTLEPLDEEEIRALFGLLVTRDGEEAAYRR